MRKLSPLLLYSVTVLSLFVTITGFLTEVTLTARIFQILFVPVTFLLVLTSLKHIFSGSPPFDRGNGIKRLIVYYGFIVSSVLVIVGFLSATTVPQYISSFIFTSLIFYFLLLVWPRNAYPAYNRVHEDPESILKPEIKEKSDELDLMPESSGMDFDKRDFLKLVGTAGITAFVLGLVNKRGFSFFGSETHSVSTASLTDTEGNKINPAQQNVIDNYSITEIDDANVTAYFGFTNDKGGWYIMKEDGTGAFRYVKGDDSFPRNWVKRDELSYDYFSNVF